MGNRNRSNYNGPLTTAGTSKLLQGQKHLHQVGSVVVYESAKSQSAPERRGHVGDGHVPVAVAVRSAPLLQSLDGSHSEAKTAEPEPETLPGAQEPQDERDSTQSQDLSPESSCVLFPPAEGARRLRDAPAAAGGRAVGVTIIHHPQTQESPEHQHTGQL